MKPATYASIAMFFSLCFSYGSKAQAHWFSRPSETAQGASHEEAYDDEGNWPEYLGAELSQGLPTFVYLPEGVQENQRRPVRAFLTRVSASIQGALAHLDLSQGSVEPIFGLPTF